MASEVLEVPENSVDLDVGFSPSRISEDYVNGPIFNRGEKRNVKIYSMGSKAKISIGPFAGIIQLQEKRIHFSTKVRTNLFYMLSYLKREDEFLFDPQTPIEIKEGTNFFDILGRFFLNELNEVLEKGLLRKYVRKQENRRFLKGKLILSNQVRQNLVDKSKFYCEYEDLTFDNLENQTVLSALNLLISLIKFNQDLKHELRKLKGMLKYYITLKTIAPLDYNNIRFDRINLYYKQLIEFSKLIIEERYIRNVKPGYARGFNFIVNMNAVFEDFITDLGEEVIATYPEFSDYRLEKQSRFKSLVKEKTLVTKPDIILTDKEHKHPFIIDAKYKRDAANADYYQVIAYSLALKSKKCCLVYPVSEKEIDKRPLTLVHDSTKEQAEETIIIARTIDLHINEITEYRNYIQDIKNQLRTIFLDVITL